MGRGRLCKLAGVAFGLLLLGILSRASAQADDDMEARLEAAKTNYETCNFDADLRLTAELEAHSYAVSLARRGGKETEDLTSRLEKIVEPEFIGLIDKKRQIYIKALAENLTVADLKVLNAFNNTPEGKKFAAVRLAIVRSIYAQAMPLVRAAYVSAWIDHKDEFEKLGLTFAEKKQ